MQQRQHSDRIDEIVQALPVLAEPPDHAVGRCHALRDEAMRDQHLEHALDVAGRAGAAPELREGVLLRAARWSLDQRDAGAALARLNELPAGATRRTAALQAGFRDLLVKPLPPATLLQAVREALAIRVTPPDWDHAAAAAALNHQPANVEALRQLFLAELAQARQQVLDHVRDGNTIALRACLHRLQASCGLVGARRLGDAVDHLRAAPASRAALDEFIRAAQDLLH